jgi:hypothetical protein
MATRSLGCLEPTDNAFAGKLNWAYQRMIEFKQLESPNLDQFDSEYDDGFFCFDFRSNNLISHFSKHL